MYTSLRLNGYPSFLVLHDITLFLFVQYDKIHVLYTLWLQLCGYTKMVVAMND